MATARPAPGQVIVREATATIGLATAGVSPRPITRVISRVPLRVVGEARPRFVGPPAPPTLRKVTRPRPAASWGTGSTSPSSSTGASRPTTARRSRPWPKGSGWRPTRSSRPGPRSTRTNRPPDVVIHVLASAKAKPGPHPVRVSYAPPGRPADGPRGLGRGPGADRGPARGRGRSSSRPGDSATIPVEVRREAGFDGEVEMKLEGLPRGSSSPGR